MKVDRLTRVNELLRREIGGVLYRLLDPATFDLSAVTITRVITSSDLRSARVLVSIRGHEQDRDAMLARLQRLHGAIQEDIAEKVALKYTPVVHFVMDHSIEDGDRVLSILSRLGGGQDAPEEPGPTEESG